MLEANAKPPDLLRRDQKPGIQALATDNAEWPPNRFASHVRDSEHRRLGTVSLLENCQRDLVALLKLDETTHLTRITPQTL